MTDIRETLDEIAQRAAAGAISDWDPRGGDEPYHRVTERHIRFGRQIRADAASLVAALRAVLDLHQRWDAQEPWCAHCIDVLNTYVDWPCRTVAAITEALGGDA